MEEHKSDEEAGSGEGSSSLTSTPDSVREESIALDADRNSDPASEISTLPSTSKSYRISEESGVGRSPICLDDIEHDALKESSTSLSSDSSEVSDENTKPSKTQQSAKNMINLTKGFKTIREVYLRPISEDKDVGTEEIVVRNSPRLSPAAETASGTEEQTCSNLSEPERDIITPISSSSDSQGYEAEEGILKSKDKVASTLRYERNLRKFLNDTKSENKSISMHNKQKQKRKTAFSKNFYIQDGTLSDILNRCGVINRISSFVKKIKIGRISNSAPSSFTDNSANSDEYFFNDAINSESSESSMEVKPPLSNCQSLGTEAADLEKQSIADKLLSNKQTQTSPEISTGDCIKQPISDSSKQGATAGPSGVFKVPILPKRNWKSPKDQSPKLELSSPGTTKISENLERSPSDSPRRPTDFNVSPRRAIYMFCHGSPSHILRQYRSLPNISNPPTKEIRRQGMNFENKANNSSVKALFTEEMSPVTPESSVSSVVVEEAAQNFLSSQAKSENRGDSPEKCPESKASGDKQSFESSVQSVLYLSSATKLRKKLVFVSNNSENTNITPTLQDSSSSLDIATNISSLKIVDAEKSSVKIPIEPLSKRKYASPDLSAPECSSGVSRKVPYLDEQAIEMAAASASTAESQDKTMDISPPSAGEMDTSDLTAAQLQTPHESDSEDVPEYVMGTKYSRSKDDTVPFHGDETSVLNARRELFRRLAVKRAKQTSSSEGDDIADKPDEPKKKKESEPKKRKGSEE